MKGRLCLAIGLAVGLTLIALWIGTGPPLHAQAQATCDRYVLGVDGADASDCSDEAHPCATIQYAIDQAVDGDSVCVARHTLAGPLTYNERLTITESIELHGAWDAMCVDPSDLTCSFTAIPCDPANVTVDAGGTGRVVTINGDITPTIDCFTITGGDANLQYGGGDGTHAGGGIYSYDAAPIIVNNVITANYGCNTCNFTYGRGGGIYLYNAPSTAVISGNVIANNVADESTWGQGGGILLWNSDAQILHNTITSNRAGHSSGYGGGIAVRSGTPVIADNLFEYNYAGLAVQGLGGAIFVWSPDPATIERNVIRYNQALHGTGDPGLVSYGGGIFYDATAPVAAIIRDNVIDTNLAVISGGKAGSGGGMYIHNFTSDAVVSGNTIEWNQSCNSCPGYGGGIYVSNSEVTIDDNHLESNAACWAGPHGEGGGVYVDGGAVVLQSNVITGNAGSYFTGFPSSATGYGGGIMSYDGDTVIQDNEIVANAATNGENWGVGGGIYAISGTLEILDNMVYRNHSSLFGAGFGGGIGMTDTVSLVQGNQIVDNVATAADGGAGGGIYASSGSYTILGNTVQDNQASGGNVGVGGGIYTDFSSTWIDANVVLDNRAAPGSTFSYGGGIRVAVCDPFTLTNNIVARNGATDGGSGIAITSSDGVVAHNTVAENSVGDGSGVAVQSTSVVTLYNNIVASQTVGINNLDPGSASVIARYTLFEANGTNTINVTSSEEFPGPAMLLPDYHIGVGSNAIDQALDLGWVTHDIDGDVRPLGSAPEIGADEYSCLARTGGNDYDTIQGAIDAATSGATVMVAEGICYENLSIDKTVILEGGWGVTFSSRHLEPALHTTIDGLGRGRVISITEGFSAIAPTIDGFTIINGDATGLGNDGSPSYDTGGGIYSYYADTTVSDCVVRENVASTSGIGWGGGLGFFGGTVTVEDTVVEDNSAISINSNGYGGGIFSRHTYLTLERNTVQRNVGAELGQGYGGGLSFLFSDVTMVDNIVRENLSTGVSSTSVGGGIRAYMTTINMDGDVIAGNQTHLSLGMNGYGGGLAAQLNCDVTMDSVEVSDNEATFGGGIYVEQSAEAVLTNNDVFSNTAGMGGGIDFTQSPSATLTNNRVYSNVAGYAGGVWISSSGASTLTGNEIHDNAASLSGGLWLYGSDDSIVTANYIYNNVADDDAGGVLVMVNNDTTFTDNSVYNNTVNDYGGGFLFDTSGGVMLVENDVYDNEARYGGGIYFLDSPTATVTGNTFYGNEVGESGGGLYATGSPTASIEGNVFYENRATDGPAISLYLNNGTDIADNQVYHNTGGEGDSGVIIRSSDHVSLIDNQIYGNGGGSIGGVWISKSSYLTIARNLVYSNTCHERGGGLYLDDSSDILLENNIVADNHAGQYADGIGFGGSTTATMLHTTVARNGAGSGDGVYLESGSSVDLANTIIVGHGTGIYVVTGGAATFEATLWGTGTWANGTNWDGGGALTPVAPHIYKDPSFVDPASGNYHIAAGSGAIDAGIDAGVNDDIDGNPRPLGDGFDIGADEVIMVYLPLIMRNF